MKSSLFYSLIAIYFLLSIAGLSACTHHPIHLPLCAPLLVNDNTETGNYWLSQAFISGQCLYVQLSHGGGCAEHSYELSWGGGLAESMPPQAFLVLRHIDPGDPCDAIIETSQFFDLTPLIDEPYDQIIVHVTGWETPLMLED